MIAKCRYCRAPIFIVGSPEFIETEPNICLNCLHPKEIQRRLSE